MIMYFAADPSTYDALQKAFGPAAAIVILALAVSVWQLYRKLQQVQEDRVNDMKEVLEKYGAFGTQVALLVQKITDATPNKRER